MAIGQTGQHIGVGQTLQLARLLAQQRDIAHHAAPADDARLGIEQRHAADRPVLPGGLQQLARGQAQRQRPEGFGLRQVPGQLIAALRIAQQFDQDTADQQMGIAHAQRLRHARGDAPQPTVRIGLPEPVVGMLLEVAQQQVERMALAPGGGLGLQPVAHAAPDRVQRHHHQHGHQQRQRHRDITHQAVELQHAQQHPGRGHQRPAHAAPAQRRPGHRADRDRGAGDHAQQIALLRIDLRIDEDRDGGEHQPGQHAVADQAPAHRRLRQPSQRPAQAAQHIEQLQQPGRRQSDRPQQHPALRPAHHRMHQPQHQQPDADRAAGRHHRHAQHRLHQPPLLEPQPVGVSPAGPVADQRGAGFGSRHGAGEQRMKNDK